MTPDILYAIASDSLCDIKTVRKWAKGEKARAHMKPAVRLRLDRSAARLGVVENASAAPIGAAR